MQIYIAKDGRQDGPFTVEYINSEVAAGRIKPTDLAWTQGWSGWQPVSLIPGFLTASSPPPGVPPPPPPPPTPGGRSLTQNPEQEALLQLFVGKNYEYYSAKWTEAEQKPNKHAWNWAAFFLNFWWAAYRKMYRSALIVVAILVAVTVCERMFGFPSIIALGINIGIAVVYGLRGNWWYRLHAEEKLRQIAPSGVIDDAIRFRIAKVGGTSGLAVVGFVVLVGVLQVIGVGVAGTNPKDRTLAAWNSFQKIDRDNLGPLRGKVDDITNSEPAVKAFRNMSASYAKIDLTGVDQLLVDHLHHRATICSRAADVLESQYSDIVDAMKAHDAGINLSRSIGGALADEEHRDLASEFAGWLYKLSTSSDFETQLQEIIARHRPEVQAMSQEVARLDEEEKTTANSLTQKYGVQFGASE